MDILNPDIELIDGCYYRINPIDVYSFGTNAENLPYQEFNDEEEEDDKFENETRQDGDEEIPNLILRDDGFYVAKVHVASSDRGICEEAFLRPEKLHLTVDVMTLADNVERNIAIDTLHKFKESYIDSVQLNKPIKIRVQGLEIMNDDPSDVRVLYGKVAAENNSLQQLVDNIANFFSTTGLTCASRESVKLHATLMNARFISLRTTGIENRDESFDARNILKHYENYDFGEILVDTILLSQSHSVGADGYYETSSKITFYSTDKTG